LAIVLQKEATRTRGAQNKEDWRRDLSLPEKENA
jgi:hypothetical protein